MTGVKHSGINMIITRQILQEIFLSPPVRMHGGLICIAFCLSVTGPKVTRPKIISQQPFNLASWNLVRKPSLNVMSLAGGLMSTSSCIFFYVLTDTFIKPRCIKNLNGTFWPRVHRLERWSQNEKMPPGVRAKIENFKYAKSNTLYFTSATRWHFWTFTPLFLSFRFLIYW